MKHILQKAVLITAAAMPGQNLAQEPPAAPQAQVVTVPAPQMTTAPDGPPQVPSDIPAAGPLFSLDGLDIHLDRQAFRRHIRKYENIVLHPYKDKLGIVTIGPGFNMQKGHVDPAPGDPSFNGKRLEDPSAEEIWKFLRLPENFREILENGHGRNTQRLSGISQESSDRLEEASIDQAIHNAAATFRHFNAMSPKQQMAVVDLVYNMGTNLKNHPDLIEAANGDKGPDWKKMRESLVHMGYHRTDRARNILAMLTPEQQEGSAGHRHGRKRHGSHPRIASNASDGQARSM